MMALRFCSLVGLLALQASHAQLVVDLTFDEVDGWVRVARPVIVAAASGVDEANHSSGAAEVKLNHPALCDENMTQYSGYFDIRGTGLVPRPRYFFWFVESRRDPAADPVVMWLNGGPGCSSIAGLLLENGPCTVKSNGAGVENNRWSWTTRANVLWVDQPAPVGFSEGSQDAYRESQVGTAMYGFLLELFSNSELRRFARHDFFVIGESYAGHYVPAVAHRVWLGNRNKEGEPINLKGVGIGNGLTVASVQYGYYRKMAADGGRELGGSIKHGAISDPEVLEDMQRQLPDCLEMTKACQSEVKPSADDTVCARAFYQCAYSQIIPYMQTGLSPYNMRNQCPNPPLCVPVSNVEKYLNTPRVQAQLGVHKRWEMCSMSVREPFLPEWMRRFDVLMPDMLADGIRILVYAGDLDFICNWLGNKAWTLTLEWPHQDKFNKADDEPFLHDGRMAGRIRTAANLSFLQVFEAGHMVPIDQPSVSLEMLDRFLDGRFEDTAQDGSGAQSAKTLLAVPSGGSAGAPALVAQDGLGPTTGALVCGSAGFIALGLAAIAVRGLRWWRSRRTAGGAAGAAAEAATAAGDGYVNMAA